jgi:flagellin
MVINTNTANTALHYLNSMSAQSSSAGKIASGSRITKASDDAAGLAIGTQLNCDVTVLSQAGTSASRATSLLQAADGSLANIGDMAQRMRSLAVQSASANVTDTERAYIATEFQGLAANIDTTAKNTRAQNTSLLDGSFQDITFTVGISSSDTITVSLGNATAGALGIGGADVSTKEGAEAAMKALDGAISQITQQRANVGALTSRFDFRSEQIATTVQNTQIAKSNMMDVDVTAEKSHLAIAQVRTQAAIAVLSQANQLPQGLIDLLR